MNKKTNVDWYSITMVMISSLLVLSVIYTSYLVGYGVGYLNANVENDGVVIGDVELNYFENIDFCEGFSSASGYNYSEECNVLYGDVCVDNGSKWFQCDMRERICYAR